LRRAGDRSAPAASAPIRIGDLEVDCWRREARMRGEVAPLTPTEFRLLETLARHPGRTFTREELVSRAFGPDYEGMDRTIDTHVTNLRRKLEPGRTPTYILTVHGLGYRLRAPHA
jgi:DNA-binding response OmpR family regulator